jgi:FMN phosphatase YigB (HAD superfamily)
VGGSRRPPIAAKAYNDSHPPLLIKGQRRSRHDSGLVAAHSQNLLQAGHPLRHTWQNNYIFPRNLAATLYPGALDAVKHVQQWGIVVILSDGDAVFQPRKFDRSGLWQAFYDRVLIYVHKEQELDDVERFYPADHYVL